MLFDIRSSFSGQRDVYYWMTAFGVLFALQNAGESLSIVNVSLVEKVAVKALAPLLVCFILTKAVQRTQDAGPAIRNALAYVLFFSISLTSFFGLTKTLTGSHAASDNLMLYGLSFYTATLAFFLVTGAAPNTAHYISSNPLLLMTGPIPTVFRRQSHRRLGKRFAYYFPFVVLGMFLHQAIATPLTQTFFLIAKTDMASSVTFALIFELFVYANFCGLSLAVYGLMGILGVKVPLNFRQPFSSNNLVSFWKGWHTSLSTVLKVLFYKPARNALGTTAAILVVYLGSAMWHGVTLNFLLWGFFHALCFIITLFLLRRGIPLLPALLQIFGVVIGRLLFADADTGRLLDKLTFQFKGFGELAGLLSIPNTAKLALLLISLFVAAEFIFQKHDWFRGRTYKWYRLPVVQLVLLLLTLMTLSDGMGVDYAVYGQR